MQVASADSRQANIDMSADALSEAVAYITTEGPGRPHGIGVTHGADTDRPRYFASLSYHDARNAMTSVDAPAGVRDLVAIMEAIGEHVVAKPLAQDVPPSKPTLADWSVRISMSGGCNTRVKDSEEIGAGFHLVGCNRIKLNTCLCHAPILLRSVPVCMPTTSDIVGPQDGETSMRQYGTGKIIFKLYGSGCGDHTLEVKLHSNQRALMSTIPRCADHATLMALTPRLGDVA